jgi:phosphate acetyltransferase
MQPLERLIERARANTRRIVLAEGDDPRVIEAALRARREGLAEIILIGDAARIRSEITARDGNAADFAIEDPRDSPRSAVYAEIYFNLRKHKGVDETAAAAAMRDPMGYAAMMVRQGDADGMIGGAVATTAHTVRTALQIIGKAPESRIVSSFFLMLLCQSVHAKKGAFVFADCGLVVDPDKAELADIAIASAQSYEVLTKVTPRVAMLSFSTMGSATHERVNKVVEATKLVKAAQPDLLIDGELQFDAAFVPAITLAKASDSLTGGEANVFVFPNIEAGNIGYKIAQRVGNALAIGPILQGLAKPANDLSRGCNAEDIYYLIAVTSIQASEARAAPEIAGTHRRGVGPRS